MFKRVIFHSCRKNPEMLHENPRYGARKTPIWCQKNPDMVPEKTRYGARKTPIMVQRATLNRQEDVQGMSEDHVGRRIITQKERV